MEKERREGLENYKRIVDLLLELEKCWEKHTEFMSQRPHIGDFPRNAQRFLKHSYNRSKFVLGVPRILENARVIGGLQQMVFELPVEAKTKKEKE